MNYLSFANSWRAKQNNLVVAKRGGLDEKVPDIWLSAPRFFESGWFPVE